MPKLVHSREGQFLEDIELTEGRWLIGRRPECDIRVDDETVSGKHALIIYDDLSKQAVAYRGEVSAVYVKATDGRLRLQQVVLGRQVGDDIVVLAGLSEGAEVALDPVQAAVQVKSARSGK